MLQEDGSNCSIFSFDISANRSALPLAKNALKKLRTLRHPGVIKVLDTAEVPHHPNSHQSMPGLTSLNTSPTRTSILRQNVSSRYGGMLRGRA